MNFLQVNLDIIAFYYIIILIYDKYNLFFKRYAIDRKRPFV